MSSSGSKKRDILLWATRLCTQEKSSYSVPFFPIVEGESMKHCTAPRYAFFSSSARLRHSLLKYGSVQFLISTLLGDVKSVDTGVGDNRVPWSYPETNPSPKISDTPTMAAQMRPTSLGHGRDAVRDGLSDVARSFSSSARSNSEGSSLLETCSYSAERAWGEMFGFISSRGWHQCHHCSTLLDANRKEMEAGKENWMEFGNGASRNGWPWE